MAKPQKRITTIWDLTDDLLMDIFSRLRAKFTHRCKVVCKPWLALLTGTPFIDSHFKRSSLKDPNIFLLKHYHQSLHILYPPHEFDHETMSNNNIDCHPLPEYIVGCCNGLICFCDIRNYMYFCNPSTRETVHVPLLYRDCSNINDVVMGFGYDPFFKEYKVVMILLNSDRSVSLVMVYTLGKNASWRILQEAPTVRFHEYAIYTALLNGVLHMNGMCGGSDGEEGETDDVMSNSIVTFNLTTDKFGEIPWPDFDDFPNVYEEKIPLEVWGGRLVAYRYWYTEGVNIWMMQEYGVEQSWTRIYSIGRSDIGHQFEQSWNWFDRSDIGQFEQLNPITMMKNGEILMCVDYTNLILYDPVKRSSRVPVVLDLRLEFDAIPYQENLISLALLIGGDRSGRVSETKQDRDEGTGM